jgi:hypothetical protein
MNEPKPGTPHAGDRGSATVWMVFATVIVLAVAGLVYDGGGLIATKRQTIDNAEQAARAGAQAIDTATLMATGTVQLDPPAAIARTEAFLAADGWTGTVTADTTSVTVTITRRVPLAFLATFGLADRTVTGDATAQPHHDLARS